MYPTIPSEVFSSAIQLVSFVFAMVAVLIGLTITGRG
jgi:hypothetical protein